MSSQHGAGQEARAGLSHVMVIGYSHDTSIQHRVEFHVF
jgi:hypothetical protein